MTLGWVIALVEKRNDIADTLWGIGFVLLAWGTLALRTFPPDFRSLVITTLVTIWGLRLAIHVYKRNHGKPEDFRYKAWREQWGKWYKIYSYLKVFLLQGIFMFFIAFSPIIANTYSYGGFGLISFIGLVVWIVGFVFESVGDRQLAHFIAQPENKGALMTSGLWKYTRHPNYFGEVTQWWGLWLIALPVMYGWIALISPLVITFLILKVSGIPMLEKKYEGNTAFNIYKTKTSAFFPWFPKK